MTSLSRPNIRSRFSIFAIWAVFLTIVMISLNFTQAETSEFPTRTITIVNPWGPGNVNDLTSRAIGAKLSKKEMFGVPIEVISKPGGSSVVGTSAVMSSEPDGYTILADGNGSSSMQLAMAHEMKLPYKVEERTFLARAVTVPYAFTVPASAPWKTLGDVGQAIRKDPSSFRWASRGSAYGEFPMKRFRAILKSQGIDSSQTKLVPFSSGSKTIVALAGSHIDISCQSVTHAQSLVSAGKIRIIAVASTKRSKLFPDVPTTAEQGFPTIIAEFWVGYSGPSGLPQGISQKWIDSIKTIVNDPNMLPTFDKLGVTPAFLGGEEFKASVIEEGREIKSVLGQ